jgi:hypothetical protein
VWVCHSEPHRRRGIPCTLRESRKSDGDSSPSSRLEMTHCAEAFWQWQSGTPVAAPNAYFGGSEQRPSCRHGSRRITGGS